MRQEIASRILELYKEYLKWVDRTNLFDETDIQPSFEGFMFYLKEEVVKEIE